MYLLSFWGTVTGLCKMWGSTGRDWQKMMRAGRKKQGDWMKERGKSGRVHWQIQLCATAFRDWKLLISVQLWCMHDAACTYSSRKLSIHQSIILPEKAGFISNEGESYASYFKAHEDDALKDNVLSHYNPSSDKDKWLPFKIGMLLSCKTNHKGKGLLLKLPIRWRVRKAICLVPIVYVTASLCVAQECTPCHFCCQRSQLYGVAKFACDNYTEKRINI